MHSFVDIERTFGGQPPRLGAILARIDVGRGREQLYRDQVPELLRSLASQTRVESISASSAIEGVVVDPDHEGGQGRSGHPVVGRGEGVRASGVRPPVGSAPRRTDAS